MAERCPWGERVVAPANALDDDVLRHLETCSACRAEGLVHEDLVAAFRGSARPELSPHFRPQLMQRVEKERRRRSQMRQRLVVLRLYWSVAAVVCAAVVGHLGAFSPTTVQEATILFALALFAVPIGVLLMAIRINPIELVFETLMTTTEKPAPGPQ